MKKSAQLIMLILIAGMLAACGGKNSVTEKVIVTDEESDETIADETAIVETTPDETSSVEALSDEIPLDEATSVEASKDETSSVEIISSEDLCKVYVDYIEGIAKDSDTADELVFATVDVNNDGTRELLYAESSVNAAGVYVCFYNAGKIVPAGPFGCYGGIKYAPAEGKIISEMDNMDYLTYELVKIDENCQSNMEQRYGIEPDSEDNSYHFFLDDEEVDEPVYTDAFKKLQDMDVRYLDYYDMYSWCNSSSDPIEQRFEKMLLEDDPSRECHMIIPMVEKAKLIGTWEMYSSEIEGEISYAQDGAVNGKITVHEDYTVDFDFGRHKMSGMMMDFYQGSFNDYADNTDWYVVVDASEEDGTTIYMNVSDEDQLTVNTIGEGETLLSLWDIYNRAK